MTPRRGHPDPRPSTFVAAERGGSGFTLAELIVSVAAVALLTVGIGQLFNSVGKLVSAGAALAETDQFARALESQMRADFASLSGMRSEDTFMVIRNRRLGNVDRDRFLDAGEKAIYINSEDQDADRRLDVDPYARGSKAVTVRLDEVMFLAAAGSDSASAQRAAPGDEAPGIANVIRVYYGHGLRPPANRAFDIQNPPSGRTGNVPPRVFFPDGDFGDPPLTDNRYFPTGAPDEFGPYRFVQGRNQFAGDWLFLRQPLLLTGGLAAGFASSPPPGSRRMEWGYVPFIRGLENTSRSFDWWEAGAQPMDDTEYPAVDADFLGPFARALHQGRTDICAQSVDDVKRWLEGLAPSMDDADLVDASAFTNGRLDDDGAIESKWIGVRDGFPSQKIDAPLWKREGCPPPPPPPLRDPCVSDVAVQAANHQRLISAIAGCLARFQAEDDPPLIDRRDVLAMGGAVAIVDPPRPRFEQFMDMHAVIASRVSNFEIAWTDGQTWVYDDPFDRNNDDDPTDADGDGERGLSDNINRGDVIWFDMDFWRDFSDNGRGRSLLLHDPDDVYPNQPLFTSPEVRPGDRRTQLFDVGDARYDALATGADDDGDGINEYLAVFPFRVADTTGRDWQGPYPKPARIRVRFTIHDRQFRIPGGKQYEFQLAVDLD